MHGDEREKRRPRIVVQTVEVRLLMWKINMMEMCFADFCSFTRNDLDIQIVREEIGGIRKKIKVESNEKQYAYYTRNLFWREVCKPYATSVIIMKSKCCR